MVEEYDNAISEIKDIIDSINILIKNVEIYNDLNKNLNKDNNIYLNKNLNNYKDFLNKFGDSAQGVGWRDTISQKNRFDEVSKYIYGNKPSVIDIGCGTGALYTHLIEKKKIDYEGIDLLEESINLAKLKGINATKGDIENLNKTYDFSIALGTFHLLKWDIEENSWDYIKDNLVKMWERTNKKMIFTLLTKSPTEDYLTFEVKKVQDFLETLTGYYDIITNKENNKLTDTEAIFILSKDSLENDAFEIRKSYLGDLESFLENSLFLSSFTDISKKNSNIIKNLFIEFMKQPSSEQELVGRIVELTGDKTTKEDAERIVRTEMTSLRNKAREFTFTASDIEGIRRFKWLGPNDDRTTKICFRIKSRTAKGVTIERLKEIVKEEALRANPKFITRDFLPHINCRHTFVVV